MKAGQIPVPSPNDQPGGRARQSSQVSYVLLLPGSTRQYKRRCQRKSVVSAGWLAFCALFFQGCAYASTGHAMQAPYLSPLLTPPSEPVLQAGHASAVARRSAVHAAEDSGRRGQKGGDLRQPASKARHRLRKAAAETLARPGPTVPALILSPGRRDPVAMARSLLVVSARRLLGVVESFDHRSFLGHILLVCALLPRGMDAQDLKPMDYLKFATKKGVVLPVDQAQAGDVVLFTCPGGCGESASDGVAAGVVIRAHDQGIDVIAYVDARVRRCHYGKTGPGPFKPCRIPSVLAVVATADTLRK